MLLEPRGDPEHQEQAEAPEIESVSRAGRKRGGKTGRPRPSPRHHATADTLPPVTAFGSDPGVRANEDPEQPRPITPTDYQHWKEAFMQALGEVVREGRLAMELPQTQLASAVKRMGERISDAQVNRLENNKGWAERSLFAILALGIRLGIPPSELIERSERRLAGNPIHRHLQDVVATAELMADLSPDDFERVRAYVLRLRNTAAPPTAEEQQVAAEVQAELRRMRTRLVPAPPSDPYQARNHVTTEQPTDGAANGATGA
jgi:transcriptional regulator with XRE-family HTH domain